MIRTASIGLLNIHGEFHRDYANLQHNGIIIFNWQRVSSLLKSRSAAAAQGLPVGLPVVGQFWTLATAALRLNMSLLGL